MTDALPPLTWEASHNEPAISASLPDEVILCLQNAKYVPKPPPSSPPLLPLTTAFQLHLATCIDQKPHVSLMNYTYLPSHPSLPTLPPGAPLIIMTTNPSSRKTLNLLSNPNVSLLVHDWVSSRPPPQNPRASPPPPSDTTSARRPSASGGGGRSSLATLLMGMNTSAMGSISATLNGTARVLERGSEVERWCRGQHLACNEFGKGAGAAAVLSGSPEQGRGLEEERDDEIRVVVVQITDGRVSDMDGAVREFIVARTGEGVGVGINGSA